MSRALLRQTLAMLTGIALAIAGGSITAQAMTPTEMRAAPSGTATAGMCHHCDEADANAMNCRGTGCFVPTFAILRSGIVVRTEARVLEVPASAPGLLVGWTHAPEPHPPKASTLD